MATIDWNGGSGDWNDSSDWTPGQVPTAGDDATVAGTIASAITISSADSIVIANLTIDNPLASLEVDGYLSADTIALQSGTIIDDGTIANATIAMDGGTFAAGAGWLHGDTIEGNLDLANTALLFIQGGLTATGLNGTGDGTITIDGSDSNLIFNDATDSFDNATITIGSAGGLDSLSAGGILTLGTGVVVQTTTAFFSDTLGSDSGGTIINDGLIDVDATSGTMDLSSPGFINNGQITVTGGAILDVESNFGTFANSGTLTIGNASTAAIEYINAFTNTGFVEVQGGGELDLDLYASALTQSQTAGGTVEVDGLLNAEGDTLNIGTDTGFSTLLNYGTIENATLVLNGGSLGMGFSLFKNDTVEGNFTVDGEATAEIQGSFAATGIDGTGDGTITIDGSDSTLLFNDATDSLDNTTITIGSATGLDSISAGGILTLGTGVVVQTTTAFFSDTFGSVGAGTIINDGSIIVDATSGTMNLESPGFINNGQITVTGGADLDITPYGTFANNGTLTVGNGSTAAIEYLTGFTNTGFIEVQGGGELDLDTYASALTIAQTTGGTIEVDGLLNAEGETLNIAANTDFSTVLNYGTIENAVLKLNGGTFNAGGWLHGDTIEGNLDLVNSAQLFIQGGLTATGLDGTGDGTITIDGSDSNLIFNDATDTFDNATITIGSAGGLDSLSAGGILTLGTGVVVQTTTAFFSDTLGSDSGGTIINDGLIDVDASSGTMNLSSPGFINNGQITVAGGAGLNVESNFGTFSNAGTLTIDTGSTAAIQYLNAFINTGAVDVDGGQLLVDTNMVAAIPTTADIMAGIAVAGTITVENGGTATFDIAVDANQTISFAGHSNSVVVNDPSAFAATIANFVNGDSITLAGLADDSFSFADDVMTFSQDGTVTGTLTFTGDYQASDFITGTDSAGDLILNSAVLPCFASGTRILTARGAVAVEALREGDSVVTVTDGVRRLTPVTWIGHRSITLARHAAPEKVRPVRIAAGAFGDGMPVRDLLLSPDHAVFAEGVLVPVKHLINGSTVRFDHSIGSVTYFHVELAQHEVLLAEGLPAESYLETGGRAMFENGGLPVVLHADFSPMAWDVLSCAALKVTGVEVDAIRATLAARAKVSVAA
ncbi:Hint domain-containing protein [Acidisoma silvae]|uniref:Hint domain-containing protein n=1 Tax=Acidisoma silvae TaxID=2802396 RepID=A0A963YS92_9PROT|nr:Hint domain-containing protein [Acidisoma silvae]MCB8875991.1 Hint domain-containing protein [Acidisoma silvae]